MGSYRRSPPALHSLHCTGAVVVFVLLVYGSSVVAAFLNSVAGPYITYGKHFYQCGEGCEDTWSWRVRATHFNPARPKELQRITGYFDIRGDGIGESQWTKVVLDKRSNNQWKENYFVISLPNTCSNMRGHLPDIFRVIFGGAGLGAKPCRVPPGNYSFVNQTVKWDFPHFPIMPYGEFRFRMLMSRQPGARSDLLQCICVDIGIIPKL